MKFPESLDGSELTGLRITVGTDDETDGFLSIIGDILR